MLAKAERRFAGRGKIQGMGVLKKFSTIVALAVGLGLPIATAPAAPAAAAPMVAAGSDDLRDLLLTEDDMPKGFAVQDLPEFDELFDEVLAGYDLDQELCSTPKAASIADMKGVPAHAKPATTREKPKKSKSATAVFVNDEESLFAMEMLADTGTEIAADMVADTLEVLEECPTVEQEGIELRMSPLKWKSHLGDESAGVAMVLELTGAETETEAELTVYGKMVVVAYGDLSLTLGLIGMQEPNEKDLKRIAKAAMHKIEESSGLSTKDRAPTGEDL